MNTGHVAAGMVVVALGYVGWMHFGDPTQRACARVGQLCGGERGEARAKACAQQLEELNDTAGGEAVARVTDCIAEAQSCAATRGCLVGGTLRGIGSQFLEGLGNAFGEDDD